MIVVGIDIGLSGAMAMVGNFGDASVCDLPTRESGAGNRLSGDGVHEVLVRWAPELIVAEDIRPRPNGNDKTTGNTIHSQGSLMRSRGVIEAVADILGVEVMWVMPQTWKRHYGLILTSMPNEPTHKRLDRAKEASRHMAMTMLPGMAHALTRKSDHNRAESMLLALYGQARRT